MLFQAITLFSSVPYYAGPKLEELRVKMIQIV
jgi:hypothetical protein